MKLAVYKSKTDGKISRVHEVGKASDIEQAIIRYNNDTEQKDMVELVELDEGSLEMFLYSRSELNIKNYKEDILNMSNAMYEIEKSLDWLCNEVKDIKEC